MKQTAVEWLKTKYKLQGMLFDKDFQQAKELDKQQKMDAFRIGATTELTFGDNKAEQYYIKEYGGEQ